MLKFNHMLTLMELTTLYTGAGSDLHTAGVRYAIISTSGDHW